MQQVCQTARYVRTREQEDKAILITYSQIYSAMQAVCSGPVSRIKCKGNTWRGYGCDFIEFVWFCEEFAPCVMAACNKSQIYVYLKAHALC